MIGTFCVFVPEELVLAAGAIQVGLCAGAESEAVSLSSVGEKTGTVWHWGFPRLLSTV